MTTYRLTLRRLKMPHIKKVVFQPADTQFEAVWKTLLIENTSKVKWEVYEAKRTDQS